MVKRDADLQLVTCQHTSGDFEHVLWADCQYDRTLQLPVTWKLSRRGTFLYFCGSLRLVVRDCACSALSCRRFRELGRVSDARC